MKEEQGSRDKRREEETREEEKKGVSVREGRVEGLKIGAGCPIQVCHKREEGI